MLVYNYKYIAISLAFVSNTSTVEFSKLDFATVYKDVLNRL